MDKVGIGLVGCGLFGESHLQAFRAVPQASVAAIFDIDVGRAEMTARAFDVPRVCASLEELCSLPQVQAVDVVTPEALHLQPVLTAVGHGKHVFVEKPLATELDDCDRMIAAATAAGCFLMVGHLLRFETRYAMLKEEIDSGRLGRPVSLHARRNRLKSLLPTYGRTHPALETCIHDIDTLLWCVGEPVRRVRGYGRKVVNDRHPDTFWGILEFAGGALGIIESIWLLPDAAGVVLDDALQVVGTSGVGNLLLMPGGLSFWRETGNFVPDVGYDPRVWNSARGALRDELAYFCDCVLTDRPPVQNTGFDGRRAVQVALALMESGEVEHDVVLRDWR